MIGINVFLFAFFFVIAWLAGWPTVWCVAAGCLVLILSLVIMAILTVGKRKDLRLKP